MKNKQAHLKQYITILILAVFCNTAILAQKKEVHPLIGTWEFDYTSSVTKIERTSKARLDSVPQQKSTFEAAYRGRKIFFGDDGSFAQQLADGRRSTGTWAADNNNGLVIVDPSGNKYPLNIQTLNKTHLVLKPIVSGEAKPVLPEWYFKKLKN